MFTALLLLLDEDDADATELRNSAALTRGLTVAVAAATAAARRGGIALGVEHGCRRGERERHAPE